MWESRVLSNKLLCEVINQHPFEEASYSEQLDARRALWLQIGFNNH